jgi:hypothetical protein
MALVPQVVQPLVPDWVGQAIEANERAAGSRWKHRAALERRRKHSHTRNPSRAPSTKRNGIHQPLANHPPRPTQTVLGDTECMDSTLCLQHPRGTYGCMLSIMFSTSRLCGGPADGVWVPRSHCLPPVVSHNNYLYIHSTQVLSKGLHMC